MQQLFVAEFMQLYSILCLCKFLFLKFCCQSQIVFYVEFVIAEWQELAGSALWDDKLITNLTIPKSFLEKWITSVINNIT